MRITIICSLLFLALVGCNKAEQNPPTVDPPPATVQSDEVALDTPEKKAIAVAIAEGKDIKDLKPRIVGLDIQHTWALARIESTTKVTDQAKVLLRFINNKWVILMVGTDLSDYSDTEKVPDDLAKKWGL